MAKGTALLVGLKSVDSEKYGGWDGKNGCWGCELDVDNMDRILKGIGYETKVLKTAEATHERVLQTLRKTVESLSKEDILVFYYSGHGGQQPDFNSPKKDEMDGKDETLIAYDKQIIDDELDEIWLSAPAGVRIVMISDSCNSGSNYRKAGTVVSSTPFVPVQRPHVAQNTQAQLIHFGGCRDGFTSSGYFGGGAFTMALCNAWSEGTFQGNYRQLLEKTSSLISSEQIPQYNEYGPITGTFRNSRPFRIGLDARVTMKLTLTGADLETAKETLQTELGKITLQALKDSADGRPCAVSASGTTGSGESWQISGTLTCTS